MSMYLHRRARRAIVATLGLLLAVTSCKKRGEDPGSVVESKGGDLFLFVHIKAQDLIKSSMVRQLQKGTFPVGNQMLNWEQIEQTAAESTGVRPSRLESFTVGITDFPERGAPRTIGIVVSQDDFNQDALKAKLAKGGPSNRAGYHVIEPGMLLHFQDAKTMVFVHEDLVDQYEKGYAKGPNGWPFNAALRQTASTHSVVTVFNLEKVPAAVRRDVPDELQKLVAAQTFQLSVDIKDKDLTVEMRGEYADDAAAKAADNNLSQLVKMLVGKLDVPAKDEAGDPAIAGSIKSLRDSLSGIKHQASGKAVTASTSLQGDSLFTALILPAVAKVREASARSHSMNNLKQIGLCLHMCNDQFGFIPVIGTGEKGDFIRDFEKKPLLSWRVAILPFIEEGSLYSKFKLDEPWDSPNNKKLIPLMPKVFAIPGSTKAKPGETHYQMVVGPKAMRPAMTIQGIQDGSSNTIGVVEAADPVIWTKPDDISAPGDMPPDGFLSKLGGIFPGGFNAVFMDGSVRFIPTRGMTAERLWPFFTTNGGERAILP